jgi:hypothetical protein
MIMLSKTFTPAEAEKGCRPCALLLLLLASSSGRKAIR